MLKIIGSVIVILSATLFGMGKYNALFKRKKTLAEILDGARKTYSKLSSFHAPLHEAFDDGGEFFESASKKIINGQLPEEAVKETACDLQCLTGEDAEIIERFASGLSATSCEGQISNLAVFITGIEKQLEKSENELGSKGKLFVKGSMLVAAAIVLLMV